MTPLEHNAFAGTMAEPSRHRIHRVSTPGAQRRGLPAHSDSPAGFGPATKRIQAQIRFGYDFTLLEL